MSIIELNGNKEEILNELSELSIEFINHVDSDIGYTEVIAKNGGDIPRPMVLAHEVKDRVNKLNDYYLEHGNVQRIDIWHVMSIYDLITDMITLSYDSVVIISQIIVILDILEKETVEVK